MAIDDTLVRLRRQLEDTYGVEATAYLMDRPAGGWDSLATKDDLSALAGVLRTEFHREIRDQTRRFATLVIAAQGVTVAAIALIGAALRFA